MKRIAKILLAGWLCQFCSGYFYSNFKASNCWRGSLRQLGRQVPFERLKFPRRNMQLDGCEPGHQAAHGPMKMMSSPVELWQSYLEALDAAPLLTKSITAGVIFPAADLTAQLLDPSSRQGSDPDKPARANTNDDESVKVAWDFARSLRWLFFGFAVQAPWNHFFYVLLDGALPPTPDPLSGTTAVKVIIDQFIQAPVFTVIIFGVLGVLEGKSFSSIREQLDADYKGTMLANWGVFVPAAIVNLAFCPPQLRVLFLNVVFFAWTIYLSTIVSKGGVETLAEREV